MNLLGALARLLNDSPVTWAAGPRCRGCAREDGVVDLNPITGLCCQCEIEQQHGSVTAP